MKSYVIKIAAAVIAVVVLCTVIMYSLSAKHEKYEGGVLVQASDNTVYAFTHMQEDKNDGEVIKAYVTGNDKKDMAEGDAYGYDAEAYIDGTADRVIYAEGAYGNE